MPRSITATLVLIVVALALPAAASAAEEVVDFEAHPANTQIVGQYGHAGGLNQGVTFGSFTAGSAGVVPTVENVGASAAKSGTNVADIFDDGVEFPEAQVYGRFASTKHLVRVHVGIAAGGTTSSVALRGYDAAGLPIDGAAHSKLVFASGVYRTTLEIQSALGRIAYFRVYGGGGEPQEIKIDDVTFDVPDKGEPPPPPDFGLSLDESSTLGSDVRVRPGESRTARIVVNRLNGAHGPLRFSVSGLPAGVTAQFLPQNPLPDATVGMRVTASESAKAVDDAKITVTADPQGDAAAGQAPRSLPLNLDVIGDYDLRVTGIEVTQGIQTQERDCAHETLCNFYPSLPHLDPANPSAPVLYRGVRLVRDKRTIARVFVNVDGEQAVDDVGIVLRAFRNGQELPGSPLAREGLVQPGAFPHVTWRERTNPWGGLIFELPPEWTTGVVSLRAELRDPQDFFGVDSSECEEAACKANNRLDLVGIPFLPTGYVDVATVRLWYAGEKASCAAEAKSEWAARYCPAPRVAMAEPSKLIPLQEGGYRFDGGTYYGSLEITEVMREESDGLDRARAAKYYMDDWADDQPQGCESRRFCADQLFGVYSRGFSDFGHSSGRIAVRNPRGGYIISQPYAAAAYDWAQTHELSHGLGRVHADTECGGDDGFQEGEEWPPDNMGIMNGLGYDVFSRKVRAPRKLGALGSSNSSDDDEPVSNWAKQPYYQPAQWFDYMSYCHPGDDGEWTSVRGWEKNISLLRMIATALGRPGAESSAASAAGAGAGRVHLLGGGSVAAPYEPGVARASSAKLLRVRASIMNHSGEAEIGSVKPRSGRAEKGPADSQYSIVTRDASGQVLTRTPAEVEHGHSHPHGHWEWLLADMPAARVARVEVVGQDGAVLGSRSASAHRPKVRVLAPRGGSRVGGRRGVLVSWRAKDADGGSLLAKVDYSANDGRSWRTLHMGTGRSSVRLPSRLFSASRRARVRVRVNDGFHEVAARSGRFRSLGARPSVTISSPVGGRVVRSDESVALGGQAFDDRSVRLDGRSLRWYAGRKLLGRGSRIAVSGLKPGRRTIRLVARDRFGRTASDSVGIRVRAVRPALLALKAPSRIAPSAKRITIRVSTTVSALASMRGAALRSSARRVSHRSRRLTARVRPGSAPLEFALVLRADGKRTRIPLAIARG